MQVCRSYRIILTITVVIVAIVACQSVGDGRQSSPRKKEQLPLGTIDALPLTYTSPKDNPSTPEKIELGRLLFYDPVLSGDKEVACATCHHPEFGYAESLELSIGVNGKGLGQHRSFNERNDIPFTKRNAQTLINTAFNGIDEEGNYLPEKAPMFWDLRAGSLEQQAMLPIKTFEEMRGHGFEEAEMPEEVAKRIKTIAGYRSLFAKAFPGTNPVSDTNISKALAAFQRSLVANNTRFDKYMRGDKSAMSGGEIDAMRIFIQTGCARCHSGPMFSDFKTHILGVADNEKLLLSDSGFQSSYAFRTPSLRNLRNTGPYMHNGKLHTLENVLTFYEDLQGKELPNERVKRTQLDTLARALKVEFKNINSIIEFLNVLNDEAYDKKIPASVPSGLPVGGKIK